MLMLLLMTSKRYLGFGCLTVMVVIVAFLFLIGILTLWVAFVAFKLCYLFVRD
jgi:hypothetical protein